MRYRIYPVGKKTAAALYRALVSLRKNKGAEMCFSVFLHCRAHNGDKELRDININPDIMETKETVQEDFCKIILIHLQKIVEEMLMNEIDGTLVYPELLEMVKILENQKVK